jgi:hypothetical protein
MEYGSIARGEEHAGSDTDLMVVGTLQRIDLLPVLRKLEIRFRREVNVTLFFSERVPAEIGIGRSLLSSVIEAKTIPLNASQMLAPIFTPQRDSSLASGVTFCYLIRNSCRLRP